MLSALALRSKGYWGYSVEFLSACVTELTVMPDRAMHQPVFVAVAEDRIVGFYGLDRLDDTRCELDFLFVEPDEMAKGYGRELLEHAKTAAQQLGCTTLIIQGDPHAGTFYRAAGAKQTGHRPSSSIPDRLLPLFEIELHCAT